MATAAATNGYDKQILTNFVQRIENLLGDLLSERGSYMERCKEIRSDIKLVYDEAKDASLPIKELRTLIRTRELERKIESQINELETEERQTYEMLEATLGDFGDRPLGEAALNKAKPKDARESLGA
jgi:uncharacterized protein (UPF0335 family)